VSPMVPKLSALYK